MDGAVSAHLDPHDYLTMEHVLDTLLNKPAAHQAAGMAFNIRAIPDLFTGEQFNVGVAVIGADGQRHVRVIDDVGRLECLYGKTAENVLFLAELAAEAFRCGRTPASPNIVFTSPTEFWNRSPEQMLRQLFHDQVTVAIPQRQDEDPLDAPDSDKVRSIVYDLLRQKGTPGIVDRLIPQSPMTVINTPRGPQSVRIPLQGEAMIGGIESAAYSPQTIRVHLMDALINLDFAADAWQIGRTGLFIARPVLPKKHEAKLRQIDAAIDHVVRRVPRTCRVEVEDDLDVLTDEILNWAEMKAA